MHNAVFVFIKNYTQELTITLTKPLIEMIHTWTWTHTTVSTCITCMLQTHARSVLLKKIANYNI